MTSWNYNHPNYTIRRESSPVAKVGGTASTDYAPFRVFQKGYLKAVHLVVVSAALTTAATWAVEFNNTTVATWTIGTSAADTTKTKTINRTIAALTDLVSIESNASNVSKVHVIYECYALPDGTAT